MKGQVLRPGDRVLYDGAEWTITAVGSTVRLVDGSGAAQVVLASYLLASPGFEVLSDAAPMAGRLEALGLLSTVPDEAVDEARAWERDVLEVETGRVPGATVARPEFDPDHTTITERLQAKAAELDTSVRTVKRKRALYRDHGLWGLVDHRHTRTATVHGRVDERVVAATRAAIQGQTTRSTGTKSRLWREVRNALAATASSACDFGPHTVAEGPHRFLTPRPARPLRAVPPCGQVPQRGTSSVGELPTMRACARVSLAPSDLHER